MMTESQFGLINASHYPEQTRGNFERSVDGSLEVYEVRNEDLPNILSHDGTIITGSVDAVYNNKEWISDLLDWTAEAIERNHPVLGICFGHQVVATVLGGTVDSMGEHEVGYRPVKRVGESRLLEGIREEFMICHGHSDTVIEFPPEASLIAENDYGVQGIEQENAFGIQAHPEYNRDMAVTTVEHYESILTDKEAEQAWDTITRENVKSAETAKRIFENFIQIATDDN